MNTNININEEAKLQEAMEYLDYLDTTYSDVVHAQKRSTIVNLGINDFTGQGKLTDKQAMLNSVKIIREELDELEKAIQEDNETQILDGAVDLGVTCSNINAKLIHAGYDLASAIAETDNNNLSKFVTDPEIASASIEMYAKKGIKVVAVFHSPTGRFILLDEAQKYRKPIGFVSNDLSAFTPSARAQLAKMAEEDTNG